MGGANNSNGGNMEGIAAWGKRVRDKQGSNKVTTFQVDFPGLSRNQVMMSIVYVFTFKLFQFLSQPSLLLVFPLLLVLYENDLT